MYSVVDTLTTVVAQMRLTVPERGVKGTIIGILGFSKVWVAFQTESFLSL